MDNTLFKTIFDPKNKHSKSITKGMTKSELWKEQTGWKYGNAFDNNNKSIDFWS